MMRLILTQMTLYSSGTTKLEYLKVLDHLLDLHGKEERIAIVVDEAQVLTDDTLEELRLLSNRGQRGDRSLLQLILVGQPELAERLKQPHLRQLNQRISSRGVLRPLNAAEGVMYVECRLSAQGGQCSGIFERNALKHLLRRSDGIPRKINMLCYNAMLASFYAGERKVSVSIAKKTAAEYHDAVVIARRPSRVRRVVMPVLVAGAALASPLLVGMVYPNPWSEWLLHQVSLGGTSQQTARPDTRAVGHRKGQSSRREGKASTSTASHPVESHASLAPEAAASTPPGSNSGGSGTAAENRTVPATPALATASVGSRKQAAASPAPERGGQITVGPGDTLEEIAIRYLGSKTGINQLIAANPQLTDINQLIVGQIIYLPRGATPKASHDQTATKRQVPNAEDPPAR
jgi:LysM repeat protein